MHDPELVFDALSLKEGDIFLDMGCGPGDYSIRASEILGDSGITYALDRWQDVVDDLAEKAGSRGLGNIRAIVSDITEHLPVEDESVDLCFISTVLHSLDLTYFEKSLFGEIRRVLKPGGRVVIIECKKEEQPFGPPMSMRLSPEEIESSIMRYGFEKVGLVDLGFNYMIIPTMRWTTSIGYGHKSAKQDYYAYDRLSLNNTHTWILPKGMFLINTINVYFDRYDAPDFAGRGRPTPGLPPLAGKRRGSGR